MHDHDDKLQGAVADAIIQSSLCNRRISVNEREKMRSIFENRVLIQNAYLKMLRSERHEWTDKSHCCIKNIGLEGSKWSSSEKNEKRELKDSK